MRVIIISGLVWSVAWLETSRIFFAERRAKKLGKQVDAKREAVRDLGSLVQTKMSGRERATDEAYHLVTPPTRLSAVQLFPSPIEQ